MTSHRKRNYRTPEERARCKRRRTALIRAGLCVRCKLPSDHGVHCAPCAERLASAMRTLRRLRAEAVWDRVYYPTQRLTWRDLKGAPVCM